MSVNGNMPSTSPDIFPGTTDRTYGRASRGLPALFDKDGPVICRFWRRFETGIPWVSSKLGSISEKSAGIDVFPPLILPHAQSSTLYLSVRYPANCEVDIVGVRVTADTTSVGIRSGYQRRAAPKKRVKHEGSRLS